MQTDGRSSTDRPGLLREIWDYRFALLNLVLKDFRVRYRNMSLGIFWAVLNPLVMLGVLVVVFTRVEKNTAVANFPIFVLIGLLGFNFFSLCASSATSCIVDNATLVKKTIFPRILLPLSIVLSQAIHMAIQIALLVLFMVIFRIPVTKSCFWLPLVCVVEFVYCTGLALILSMLNVYYRDMLYVVQSGLTILFWFTPVFYPLSMVHENFPRIVFGAYILNPVAGCIDTARNAILYHRGPDAWAFSFAAAVAAASLGLGLLLFSRYQKNFADRV